MVSEISLKEILNQFDENDPDRLSKAAQEILNIHSSASEEDTIQLRIDINGHEVLDRNEFFEKLVTPIQSATQNIEFKVDIFFHATDESQSLKIDLEGQEVMLAEGEHISIPAKQHIKDITVVDIARNECSESCISK